MLSVLVVAGLIAWIGVEDVWLAWGSLSWKVWLAVPLLQLSSLILRGWRAEMTLLSKLCRPNIKYILIAAVHNAANQTLPMRSGELAYPYLLKHYCNFVLGRGVASLLYIRVYELLVLVGLVLASLLAMVVVPEAGKSSFILLLLVLFSGLFILWIKIPVMVAVSRRLLTAYAGKRETKIRKFAARLGDFLGSLLVELQRPKSLALHLGVGFLTLLNWICLILIFWVVLLGMGIPVDFMQTVVGSSVCSIAQFVPIGTLGNFGPMEAGWVVGFALVGVDMESSLSAGLAMHLMVFTSSVLIGGFAWFLLHLTARGEGRI